MAVDNNSQEWVDDQDWGCGLNVTAGTMAARAQIQFFLKVLILNTYTSKFYLEIIFMKFVKTSLKEVQTYFRFQLSLSFI